MNKNCYRYFGGLLTAQERWLNRMAGRGWRLIRTGRLGYIFAPCAPSEYAYRVEFIAHMSAEKAAKYREFLGELGYVVFVKNINLNYSLGKVRLRPWAETGGRIATNPTTFNRELLIVEKHADGEPFQLHTTYADRIAYTRRLRNPYLWMALIFAAAWLLTRTWVWGIPALLAAIPAAAYQIELMRLKREGDITE